MNRPDRHAAIAATVWPRRKRDSLRGQPSGSFAPPAFATVAEERQHRKERLAGGFRIFAACGFCEGVAGHITARDPEFPDTFWVNPFGMHFGHIKVSDLIRVDAEGDVVEGSGPVNVAAFAIHCQVHEARPDVVAAAHAHSIYGKAWSSLGRLLDPITQDACAFYEDHVFFDDTRVLVTEANEAAAHRRLPRTAQGGDPPKPRSHHGRPERRGGGWWFVSMERCCQAQFLAEFDRQAARDRSRRTRARRGPSTARRSRAGSSASRSGSTSSASSRTFLQSTRLAGRRAGRRHAVGLDAGIGREDRGHGRRRHGRLRRRTARPGRRGGAFHRPGRASQRDPRRADCGSRARTGTRT